MKPLQYIIASLLILITGCTVEGKLSSESTNRIMVCKDMRDGETFTYNTNTVKNVRLGVGAPSSFDIVTVDGKQITLTSNMESWLKCVESKQ